MADYPLMRPVKKGREVKSATQKIHVQLASLRIKTQYSYAPIKKQVAHVSFV